MSDDKAQDEINKGHRAARLLDDEAFQEACSLLEKRIMDRWRVSTNQEERERIWISVGVLEQIKGALSTAYNNGKIAKRRIDELTGARPS